MVLVIPENQNKFFYAYDILTLGNYNYTTVLLSDVNSLRMAKTIVVPNEESATKLIEYKKKYNLPYEKLIVLNLDGYGSLVNVNYSSPLSKKILDDDKLSEWITIGSGSGKIDVPYLESNYNFEKSTIEEETNYRIPTIENKIVEDAKKAVAKAKKLIEGEKDFQGEDNSNFSTTYNDYLSINVGEGNYSLWEITKKFNEHVDFSEYDYVKFNWYGKGDGKRYVVQFTSNPEEYFWYTFDDTWFGWNQVILPMHKTDGEENFLGTKINKVTTTGATWEKIIRIDFRTEASNKNQSGKFYLADFAFDKRFQTSSIKSTLGLKEIQFSTPIQLNSFPVEKNYKTLAYYEGDVPFILQKTYEDFEMFYLNVKPIIDNFNSVDFKSKGDLYNLGTLLDLINSKLPEYKPIKKSNHSLTASDLATFRNATFLGNTKIVTSSALLYLNNSSVSVNLDGEKLDFDGVSQILPININEFVIHTDGLVIDGGSGFYTRALFNSSTIKTTGESSIISIRYQNGTETTISGSEIQINLQESILLIRQPTVMTSGLTKFDDFYAYRDLNGQLRVLGEDIQFLGNVTFKTKFSDEFNIVHKTSFEGKVIRYEPIYPYDELGNFKNIFSSLSLP